MTIKQIYLIRRVHFSFLKPTPWITYIHYFYVHTVHFYCLLFTICTNKCTHTHTHISFFLWRCGPTRSMASSFMRFLDHTQRHTTVDRTPLDEWSARRRDLYLTTHDTHNRKTSRPPAGFEPTISAGERPQTYALDRAATGPAILQLLLHVSVPPDHLQGA